MKGGALYLIDLNSLTKRLTLEDVKVIMEILDADFSQETDTDIKYKTICHNGDKHKLYFYKESMTFYCYSECGRIGSILDLVKKVKEFDNVYDASEWICKQLGMSIFKEGSFGNNDIDAPRIDDWKYIDFLKRKQKTESRSNEFEILDDRILNMFQRFHPLSWISEGITHDVMDAYGIGYCAWQERITIPHRDQDGNLIGIRGRSNSDDSLMFGKYCPLLTGNITGKTCYAHNLGDNLYGLHLNKECIKRTRKVLLVEAEKSVLQMASYFGIENNFALALCGSNLTKRQIELVLELKPLEVIVALDKEFEELESEEYKQWEKKILEKFVKVLSPYCKTSVIVDRDNLLGLKDSPTDRGVETFLKLMENREVGRCY